MSTKYEASMAIQILPLNTEREDIIRIVDKVIENIKDKGFNVVVCPFETVIEASLDDILNVLKESLLIAQEQGAINLLAYTKISYNPLGVMTIDEKIKKYNN